jgi:riboflavin kinase/FMN adenylyltransferase
VVTVGFYDGLHLGHRRTIGLALDEARRAGLPLIVVTFDRHPAELLRPEAAPKLLTDLGQRLELLAEAGVDACYVIEFDEDAAAQSAETFIDEVLVSRLGCAELAVGEDFRFGAQRSGDIELLRRAGERAGFRLRAVSLGEAGGQVISATRIRGLVAEGDVAGAATLLGRVHELRGVVARGEGRGGSELGFPTANLEVDPRLALPGDGVYAGWYRDEERGPLPAAISVGRRPTFLEGAEPLIEAYLLDFSGDLYGREARVSFLERLRGEVRFGSAGELVSQMELDVAAAARLLAAAPNLAPGGPLPA